MKPQKALTRKQMEDLPAAFQSIMRGVQMHDPDTYMYLLELALAKLGPLVITAADVQRTGGRGVLGMAIDPDPAELTLCFIPGDPQRISDEIARTRSELGNPSVALDPSIDEEEPI